MSDCNCPQALALKARVAELEALLRRAESTLSHLLGESAETDEAFEKGTERVE